MSNGLWLVVIGLKLKRAFKTPSGARLCPELNEGSIADAIDKYIQHKVLYLARVKKYSNELRVAVEEQPLSKSQGTFLWVAWHVRS
jgi:hypothetical protein